MDLYHKFVAKLVEIFSYGLLAAFGGAANYVYITVIQHKRFVFFLFLANILISFFVGNVFGQFIPASVTYRDGLIMLGGFFSFPILSTIQPQVIKLLKKFIS